VGARGRHGWIPLPFSAPPPAAAAFWLIWVLGSGNEEAFLFYEWVPSPEKWGKILLVLVSPLPPFFPKTMFIFGKMHVS